MTDVLSRVLSSIHPRLLECSEGRRELCRYDPLVFMLTYLTHVMRSEETGFRLSINDLNLLLTSHASDIWTRPRDIPKPRGFRRAYLAPRGSSKTSTLKACILWSLAYSHTPYILVLSGSDTQAERFLSSIRRELDSNLLLRHDFPGLCLSPLRKSANVYTSSGGVTIESRSITSSVLGAKAGDVRPQLIILDDISRGEGTGSMYQATQRLEVVIGTVLPLNHNAPIVWTGTNHFRGSLEDDLIRSTFDNDSSAPWISEENFEVFWLHPFVTEDDGALRSIWPERWSLEFLLSERHKRSFKKDFENLPVPMSAEDWFQEALFVTDSFPTPVKVLSIDPGVSDGGDQTGLSVIGFSPAKKKACIYEAFGVRLRSTDLNKRILELIAQYPDISTVVYETNQGGTQLFYATFGNNFTKDTEVDVYFEHAKKAKLERAEILLTRYKKRQIVHAKSFPQLERECMSLPNIKQSPNVLDSVAQGIEYLASPPTHKIKIKERALPN